MIGFAAVTVDLHQPRAKSPDFIGARPHADRGEYLIRGGHVLSMDPGVGDFAVGDVHIADGRIVAVGERLTASSAEVIEAEAAVVMPGFVEVHWHMWNSLWRGLSQDGREYFALHRLAPHYTVADHYLAVAYAAAEALNAGITTCHNWAHAIRDFEDAEAEMGALLDTGIRAVFGYGDCMPGGRQSIGIPELSRAQSWLETHGDGGRIALGLVVHNSEALPAEVAAARELGLKTIAPHADYSAHPHIAGPDFIYTHGAGLPAEAFKGVAASGMKVGLCPHTDPLIGAGLPPLFEMLQGGVRMEDIGFSVDVNCQTPADPFSAMRMLLYSARISQSRAAGVADFDAMMKRGPAPDLISPRAVIELATINGARVLGMEAVTGSLTPGKRADLITVRLDQANMLPAPASDPTYQLVQHGQAANVETVIVDGRVLKRGGDLLAADLQTLSRSAAAAQMAILERAQVSRLEASR